MNRYLPFKAILVLLIAFSISSCQKDEEPTPEPTPTAPVVTGFTWKENSGPTITADSSFWTTGAWGTGIRAYKDGFANFFEVNWSGQNNTSTGAKALQDQAGLTFLKGNDVYTNNNSQVINITGFTDNKLSGNFTINMSGGTISTVEATFNNVIFK
jgi:hypothetical protein